MIKRIIYCETPSYITIKNKQLTIKFKDLKISSTTIPVEDIDMLLIDNNQITITSSVLKSLQDNKVALIICDDKHMPSGLMLPINGNSLQQERFNLQINMKQSYKNKLWKQIIFHKIKNQSHVLKVVHKSYIKLEYLSKEIKLGDSTNREAQASIYYWKNIFTDKITKFNRDKNGNYPNNLLNYGYMILRSMMSKNIVSSGLSPTIGLFHKNQFNTFCLADDLIEPFRPFVDKIVYDLINNDNVDEILTKEQRKKLIQIITLEVVSNNEITSLGLAMQNFVNSFVCFLKNEKKELEFPKFK